MHKQICHGAGAGEPWLEKGGRLWRPERHFGFPKSMEESYHINSLLSLYFYENILIVGNAVSKCVIYIGVTL